MVVHRWLLIAFLSTATISQASSTKYLIPDVLYAINHKQSDLITAATYQAHQDIRNFKIGITIIGQLVPGTK